MYTQSHTHSSQIRSSANRMNPQAAQTGPTFHKQDFHKQAFHKYTSHKQALHQQALHQQECLFSELQPKVNPHLVAAKRLSRDIRRTKDRSAAQTRTGQAICRHLIALLESSS